jgi:hypothetical protein
MRVVVFFIYLFTFLLGYGHNCYSEAQHSPTLSASNQYVEGNHLLVLLSGDDLSSLLRHSLYDIVEENLVEDDDDDEGGNSSTTKVFAKKYSLQNYFYSSCTKELDINHKFLPFLPLNGNSTPIYLANRALRI